MAIQTFNFLQFLGGLQTATSPFLINDNELSMLDNCQISYKYGAITKRLGYYKIGDTLVANKSITGLHNFRQTASTQKILATINNSAGTNLTLKYFTNVSSTVTTSSASGQKVVSTTTTTGYIVGDSVIIGKGTATEETKVIDTIQAGVSITLTQNLTYTQAIGKTIEQTWTDINVSTTYNAFEDCVTEMEDFIGYCFIVGYDSTDGVFLPKGTLTGTTFSTTDRCTNMPQGKYIKRYRDRLYVANCYITATAYPYRVYYSSVPTAGDISWTVATDFIDVDYSESITGLGENWDRLVVFTNYSAYQYNQSEKKKVWDVGCSNHRTIKNSGAYMIWANRDGVWQSTSGRPENIAGRVIDFIKAGTPSNFFAEVVDEEYYLYVGTVTVNGITFTNTRIVYNIPTKTWRIEELYNNITAMTAYNNSGSLQLYTGSTTGMVWAQSKYTDSTRYYADAYVDVNDTGQPIHSWFETKAFDLGSPQISKDVVSVIAYADRAMGLFLKARVVDNNTRSITEYKEIGQLKKYINENMKVNPEKGNFLQFEGTEMGKNPYWSFFGLSVGILVDEIKK